MLPKQALDDFSVGLFLSDNLESVFDRPPQRNPEPFCSTASSRYETAAGFAEAGLQTSCHNPQQIFAGLTGIPVVDGGGGARAVVLMVMSSTVIWLCSWLSVLI